MSDKFSACRAALVPYLGNFHIHGIPNDTVAGPVSCVGDQLAVPDAVIVPSVRPLAKDGYCRSVRQGMRCGISSCRVADLRAQAHLRLPLLVAYLIWLQMASNIPLVVVMERQSNNFEPRKGSITQY